MKKLKFLILLISSLTFAQNSATGIVFEDVNKNGIQDKKEKGIPDVAVSNGKDVVLTDSHGKYKLTVTDDQIIFVIKPKNYSYPLSKFNTPQFYYIHKPNGSPKDFKFSGVEPTGKLPKSVNFGLIPAKENNDFKVVVFGDPQPYTALELDYFNRSIVQEVKNIKDAEFGISLGDIVGDDLSLLPKYKNVMKQISTPWYNVMGNHDMNYDATVDELSDETFEKEFGPANYAWNYGDAHFIILDNIYWPDPRDGKGYWGGFRQDQLDFLRNNLSYIDTDKLVVISMHIPLYLDDGENFRPEDRQAFFDILKPFKNVLLLTAHTHIQQQLYYGEDVGYYGENLIHEYNVGTTSGDWYSGEKDEIGVPVGTMRDGTPRGYATLEISGNQYVANYKVYNQSKDYQMEVYMPKVIPNKRRTSANVMVNFFMGGSGDKVEYKIDENEFEPMRQSDDYDWNYAKSVMKWDETDKLLEGRRPSNPQISSHIWGARLPNNLEVGEHIITIKATDRYGKEYIETKTFNVEEDRIIP
ncbi:MAG: calcineurin-like phosphoesterase C-terminal domain-containing protein [Weeksellaceae bacterium]